MSSPASEDRKAVEIESQISNVSCKVDISCGHNVSQNIRMIRVLHIIQGKHFGGAEQVVYTLSKCFDRKRVEPIVLCLSDGLLLRKLAEAGIPTYFVPMGERWDILRPVIKSIRFIKEGNIDIIHTHTVRANLIGRLSALLTGRKCVTHLHSPILRDFADLRRGRLNEKIDSITRPVARKYIAVSNSLRQEMIHRGMPSNRIVTIANAVDVKLLSESPSRNSVFMNGIREEYNIRGDAMLISMIALLRPRKGVEILIRAIKPVMEHFPDLCLLIVGDDSISEEAGYGNKLRRLTSELDISKNIIFTGFREDVPSILRESDLMILPSLFGEGLPMVVLEAMASGVPVIATDVEGIPEVIEDGITGFLVKPGDIADLSNKIMKVLKDKPFLKRVADAAQTKIRTEMNGVRQAKEIEEVYREVLGL